MTRSFPVPAPRGVLDAARRVLFAPARSAVAAAALLMACLGASPAHAQDLYDTTVLRTIHLQFHDANWLQLLRDNYQSQTPILADLTIEGETYPDVGVRIRGNTSYTALPPGSEKFSLKITMDEVHADQDLWSYDTLNLNNGFRDPTFCREVVYNNFVAQFIPNARANHVQVTLNGANWGVYNNVQQADKRMLGGYFDDSDGARFNCPNNPNGPGLRYLGASPALYQAQYELQNDGGLADPWGALITVSNAVTNGTLNPWTGIDQVFAIDPSIWSVVLENLLTDDDSYVNKGADFVTYRDPIDGRMHLLQRDANETFTQFNWSITRNFTQTTKPVLNHVLSVPELRQRYMAHYRHARVNLNWAYFEPIFTAHRNLISAAVQADPKKLYSFTLFQANFNSTVTMPYGGLAGGSIIGLQQFVNQRASFLDGSTELMASGPAISAVQASNEEPEPGETVWVSAAVASVGSAISKVELFYRPDPTGVYQRLLMLDDGASGDGAAGDGVYGVQLPISGVTGQRVLYYVAATSANTWLSQSYEPDLSERGPLAFEYALPAPTAGMLITEWMYAGDNGEFVEFTNRSSAPIDMTGWSMDDNHALAGAFDLSAFGVVQPGEAVVVTEADAAAFRTAWGLAPSAKVIGLLGVSGGNNLARNDQINLYDASDTLVDRLTYGDEDFPGTIRTQRKSGHTCNENFGLDDIYAWVLAVAGDVHGSHVSAAGDLGSPGLFVSVPCAVPCPADLNEDGVVDGNDLAVVLGAWGTCAGCIADINEDGLVDGNDLTIVLGGWGPC